MNASPRIRIIDHLQNNIILCKQTKERMDGAITRAGVGETGLYIDINKDHPLVVEALAQYPVNRTTLNLILIYEVAILLAEKPELVRTFVALDSPLLEEIEQCESNGDRVRKLVHALIDSVGVVE